jgi:chlorophyllide a hydrolase
MFSQTFETLQAAVGTGIYTSLYWGIGALCGMLFLGNDLFPDKPREKTDYKYPLLLVVSFIIVVVNIFIYKNSTDTENRPLDYISLVVFGIANGVCETFIFICFFKIGETFMGKYTDKKIFLFFGGLIFFMAFSGFIHGVFWINELPPHLSDAPEKQIFRKFFMPIQFALAISWGAIYFLYRSVWAVVFLHIMVDAAVIYSTHYSVFSQKTIAIQ